MAHLSSKPRSSLCEPNRMRLDFDVKNAGNTCYIDSVIVALFSSIHNFESMLQVRTENRTQQALQESLAYLVNRMLANQSISAEEVSTFLHNCRTCGWDQDSLRSRPSGRSITNTQQDASEFFCFLIDALSGPMVSYSRNTFTGALPSESDHGAIERVPFISLGLPSFRSSSPCVCDLETLLDSWFRDNTCDEKEGPKRQIFESSTSSKRLEKQVPALHTYSLVHPLPAVVPILLQRFSADGRKNSAPVSFPASLELTKYGMVESKRQTWRLSAVVCHRGETVRSGHYVAHVYQKLLSGARSEDDKWYLFDDLNPVSLTPCQSVFREPSNARTEGYLFFYVLDESSTTVVSTTSSVPPPTSRAAVGVGSRASMPPVVPSRSSSTWQTSYSSAYGGRR